MISIIVLQQDNQYYRKRGIDMMISAEEKGKRREEMLATAFRLSKYVMKEVTISGASSTLRTIHMTFAYWGFILMSFHLGLHIRAISAKTKNRMNKAVITC